MSNFEPIKNKARWNRRDSEMGVHLPRCTRSKHSYISKRVAEKQRLYLLKLGIATYLRVYRCPICPHYHLTSKPPRK